MNLLDDSLSADLAASGRGLDAAMHERFPAPGAVRGRHRRAGHPVHLLGLRALHRGGGAAASRDSGAQAQRGHGGRGCGAGTRQARAHRHLRPTLESMPPEFPAGVRARTRAGRGRARCAERGDTQRTMNSLPQARPCATQAAPRIALAQFSMARARAPARRHRAAGADHGRQRGARAALRAWPDRELTSRPRDNRALFQGARVDIVLLVKAAVMGIVEGLTEFLPISSHRPPDPRRLAARLHRRQGQGVRHRDPDRRDLRGDHGLLADASRDTLVGLASDAAGAALRAQRADRLRAGGGAGPAVRQGDQGAPVHAGRRRQHLHPRRLHHPVGRAAPRRSRRASRRSTT